MGSMTGKSCHILKGRAGTNAALLSECRETPSSIPRYRGYTGLRHGEEAITVWLAVHNSLNGQCTTCSCLHLPSSP
ncbi:hypothetical protein WJX75_007178 [Coccomyxa subellipsoidea]|uniref:Uncharacterized protein n=1 Tax=Coccomyxa subellipsoidea TaxID=248742 RepID=A0ABR2YJP0_9CHLO